MASLYSLFHDISTRRAEEAAMRFEPLEVAAGQPIATEGEVNDAMLFVERGEVIVIAGGFEVARMGAGSIIGEIGLFTHAVRTATVVAAEDTVLQTLSRRSFAELRNAGNPIAFRIELRAVEQLASRLRQVTADIVQVATETPSMLQPARRTSEYGGHPIPLPPSRIHTALAAATAFYGSPPKALERLVGLIEARTFRPGETLASDGRDDGPMYVLAHGQIDMVAPVDGRQVRIATLDPGEVFNLMQHVDEKPRPVAWVAREGVTVLAIHQNDVVKMLRTHDLPGSVMRIAMIRSLSDRVNQANATFALARLLNPAAE
ncbi:MAG: cyclic nucleotide-binding domain-containing protein [Alphaproteobacteria bacterium]|nr:cyclic nucleotide-binding domain-containing protein [Alphaproteobacteria bacterium]